MKGNCDTREPANLNMMWENASIATDRSQVVANTIACLHQGFPRQELGRENKHCTTNLRNTIMLLRFEKDTNLESLPIKQTTSKFMHMGSH